MAAEANSLFDAAYRAAASEGRKRSGVSGLQATRPAGSRAARQANHLDPSTLSTVAHLASELNVPGCVGTSLADGKDVIELQPFSRTTVDATPLVAPPHLVAHRLWYGLTAR